MSLTLSQTHETLRIEDAVNEVCPWSGKPIAADSLTLYNGSVVGFCNPDCRDKFAAAVNAFEAALQARRVSSAGLFQ
ncbi:glutathione S-transferase [Methylobacterium sp. 77]|uniref:glutathione S-transferase n=1 Tax=Methylobacterium sp. 77 TaxID=1101192 RepID=UPI000361EFF6|nr:glutathione S-transferase [Methylobacterium sp. 77]